METKTVDFAKTTDAVLAVLNASGIETLNQVIGFLETLKLDLYVNTVFKQQQVVVPEDAAEVS